MKKTAISLVFVFFLALVSGGLLTGCNDPGPAEEAGQEIDQAVEEAGDELEEVGDEVEESVD
jgi:hypothetical protein